MMTKDRDNPTGAGGEFQRFEEELTGIQESFSQARQEAWRRELRGMLEGWENFQREWQGALELMETAAASTFSEIRGRGEAASQMLAADWRAVLAEMAEEVENWGEQMLEVLESLRQAWQGGGGGWWSWLGLDFDLGGIFHQGGIVEAHRGLLVGPEALMSDERLVKVQTGEGILPREVMAALGAENFEALRQGRLEVLGGNAPGPQSITIQVQALDAGAVVGLDWDRLVQRHILPALAQEAARRW